MCDAQVQRYVETSHVELATIEFRETDRIHQNLLHPVRIWFLLISASAERAVQNIAFHSEEYRSLERLMRSLCVPRKYYWRNLRRRKPIRQQKSHPGSLGPGATDVTQSRALAWTRTQCDRWPSLHFRGTLGKTVKNVSRVFLDYTDMKKLCSYSAPVTMDAFVSFPFLHFSFFHTVSLPHE